MIRLERRRLTILEDEALRAFAKFDPAYLFAERITPRSAMVVEGQLTSLNEGARSCVPTTFRPELAAQP